MKSQKSCKKLWNINTPQKKKKKSSAPFQGKDPGRIVSNYSLPWIPSPKFVFLISEGTLTCCDLIPADVLQFGVQSWLIWIQFPFLQPSTQRFANSFGCLNFEHCRFGLLMCAWALVKFEYVNDDGFNSDWQVTDLETVVRRFVQQSKGRNQSLVPPVKTTRSVGLQINNPGTVSLAAATQVIKVHFILAS